MSKELTEQWRNGELALGSYYVKDADGKVFIDEYIEIWDVDDVERTVFNWEDIIVEVLAPVPTHDQFFQLVKKVDELVTKCNQLEEQLKEANELLWKIQDCREDREYYSELAYNYLEKWGVE